MQNDALVRVLLDFGRAPGNYALRLREPKALFAELETMAFWAQGRLPASLQGQAPELAAAAVLFIQRACFAPENNHYQVLGLVPGPVEPVVLRARYRALIRLTHPDMGVQGLPGDAAGMVNRAHEVLRNSRLRDQYDAQLKGDPAPVWQAGTSTTVPKATGKRDRPRYRRDDYRQLDGWRGRWYAWWARYPRQARILLTILGAGVVVMGLLVWAMHDTPSGALVVARVPTQVHSTASMSPGDKVGQEPDGEFSSSGSERLSPVQLAVSAPDTGTIFSERPLASEGQDEPLALSGSLHVADGVGASTTMVAALGQALPEDLLLPIPAQPTLDQETETQSVLAEVATPDAAVGGAVPDPVWMPEPVFESEGVLAPGLPSVEIAVDPLPVPSWSEAPAQETQSAATGMMAPDATAGEVLISDPVAEPEHRPTPGPPVVGVANDAAVPVAARTAATTEPVSKPKPAAAVEPTPTLGQPEAPGQETAPVLADVVTADATASAVVAESVPATEIVPKPESAPAPERQSIRATEVAAASVTDVAAAAGPLPGSRPMPRMAPAPTPAPVVQQWAVDAPGATQYLRDLMQLLERPQEASRTHALLRSMNVRGSVLAPGLRLAHDYPQLKVVATTLSEVVERQGALNLRGTVEIATQSRPAVASRRYQLTAQFVGTASGTVLMRLDMQGPE